MYAFIHINAYYDKTLGIKNIKTENKETLFTADEIAN